MSGFLCGIKTVGLYDTGDLSGYHGIAIERTVAAGRELVQQGAQAIIPLGGKIYPYVVTPQEIEDDIGVPIINTKAVGVRFAELMVSAKTTHSQKAYPWSAGIAPGSVDRRSE